jgi:hypothetical protein
MKNGSLLGVTMLLGAIWWQACGKDATNLGETATDSAIQESIASELDTPDRRDDRATPTLKPLTKEEILEIAAKDALKAYRDISIYKVTALESMGVWNVDYELKNPNLNGGGPHYRIHYLSGEILEKRYEQ